MHDAGGIYTGHSVESMVAVVSMRVPIRARLEVDRYVSLNLCNKESSVVISPVMVAGMGCSSPPI